VIARHLARSLVWLALVASPALSQDLPVGTVVDAAFSPGGKARALVIRTIESARQGIVMAAYELTSTTIADALIAAHGRGVEVRVVVDAKENVGKGYSRMYALLHAGVPVRADSRYPIMHDKFLVVDGLRTQTGSFNYTGAAERRNAENVVVIADSNVASQFGQEFERLWNESADVERAP